MTTFCDAGPKLYWVSTFSVVRDTLSRFWKPGCTGFRSMSKILCLIKSLKGSGVISITDEVTRYGNAFIQSGIRIVKVEVDEVGKSRVPHFCNLSAGVGR